IKSSKAQSRTTCTKPLSCCQPSACVLLMLFLMLLCASTATAQTLINGANQGGAILTNGTDTYTFAASAGDWINLRIGTTNFYATLSLYGPDRALVESASNTAGTHDIGLAYQATNSGAFTVLVSSYVAGGSGAYTLRLAQVPEAFVV